MKAFIKKRNIEAVQWSDNIDEMKNFCGRNCIITYESCSIENYFLLKINDFDTLQPVCVPIGDWVVKIDTDHFIVVKDEDFDVYFGVCVDKEEAMESPDDVKNIGRKEIHFYTNLCNEKQTTEWDLETMHTDYVSTIRAINDSNERIVKTTQLEFLNNAWDYIDHGCDVYIHNSNKPTLKVEEHMPTANGKDIRYAHNICRLLCAGVFGKIE